MCFIPAPWGNATGVSFNFLGAFANRHCHASLLFFAVVRARLRLAQHFFEACDTFFCSQGFLLIGIAMHPSFLPSCGLGLPPAAAGHFFPGCIFSAAAAWPAVSQGALQTSNKKRASVYQHQQSKFGIQNFESRIFFS